MISIIKRTALFRVVSLVEVLVILHDCVLKIAATFCNFIDFLSTQRELCIQNISTIRTYNTAKM